MELSELKNIGKEMSKKLHSIGITTAEELIKAGSKDAFFRMKTVYPNICLVHLYTIQGAIDNIDYNMLPESTKADLKMFSDSLKQAQK
jgi:TfoX C-terminal domain.